MKYCDYHKVRYESETCSKCAVESWKSQRLGGCMIVFFTWPFALIGVLAGALFGAFWSAFKDASLGWDDAWKWIRKPKPK